MGIKVLRYLSLLLIFCVVLGDSRANAAAPEPMTALYLCTGLVGIAGFITRRRIQQKQ